MQHPPPSLSNFSRLCSTNAKDMVDRFKLIYNRARQAKITTELTEIISGSESLQAAVSTD